MRRAALWAPAPGLESRAGASNHNWVWEGMEEGDESGLLILPRIAAADPPASPVSYGNCKAVEGPCLGDET